MIFTLICNRSQRCESRAFLTLTSDSTAAELIAVSGTTQSAVEPNVANTVRPGAESRNPDKQPRGRMLEVASTEFKRFKTMLQMA